MLLAQRVLVSRALREYKEPLVLLVLVEQPVLQVLVLRALREYKEPLVLLALVEQPVLPVLVQQESAPQALPEQPAYRAPQVLSEPQVPLARVLTALLVQRGQPAQELQELLAPLELREPKAQQAPSASALAQQVQLVLALRVQRGYRGPPELQELALPEQLVLLVSLVQPEPRA